MFKLCRHPANFSCDSAATKTIITAGLIYTTACNLINLSCNIRLFLFTILNVPTINEICPFYCALYKQYSSFKHIIGCSPISQYYGIEDLKWRETLANLIG